MPLPTRILILRAIAEGVRTMRGIHATVYPLAFVEKDTIKRHLQKFRRYGLIESAWCRSDDGSLVQYRLTEAGWQRWAALRKVAGGSRQ
jgi:DNA-binding transcriptional ArsR family regulator